LKCFFFSVVLAAASAVALPAWADKVVVLPFTSPHAVPRPELDQARKWTLDATAKAGHTFATDDEMVSVQAATKDGIADSTQEYIVAGKTAAAQWTVTGHVDRVDYPPGRLPDGTEEEGYTTYRVELEACQVATGRVESLSREVVPEDAPEDIRQVLMLLLRPEGIANADIPWERAGVKPKPRPKPRVPPSPPSPPTEPRVEEAKPTVRMVYGEGRPLVLAALVGVTNALTRPNQALGPSWALPIGGSIGYALPDQLRGLELRAELTSQVVGPRAVAIDAGARFAFAPLSDVRLFVGPEVLLGAHIAVGADKTARLLVHGAAFLAYGITDMFQVEVAADLAPAFGGPGTLLLGGGTARVSVRF
jgi:hypothetical protein